MDLTLLPFFFVLIYLWNHKETARTCTENAKTLKYLYRGRSENWKVLFQALELKMTKCPSRFYGNFADGLVEGVRSSTMAHVGLKIQWPWSRPDSEMNLNLANPYLFRGVHVSSQPGPDLNLACIELDLSLGLRNVLRLSGLKSKWVLELTHRC